MTDKKPKFDDYSLEGLGRTELNEIVALERAKAYEQGKLEERERIKQWVNSYTRRKDFDIEWFIGGLKSQLSEKRVLSEVSSQESSKEGEKR